MHAKSLQLCPTLCNPMDCSLPAFSVQGMLQLRILWWIAMPSSRESSQPRDWPVSFKSPTLEARCVTTSACWEAPHSCLIDLSPSWTAAHPAFLSLTVSWSLSKFMSIALVMPSHPLMLSSPSAFNLSQHQGFFQWVSCSYQVTKIQLPHQSFQGVFRVYCCLGIAKYANSEIPAMTS